MIKTFKNKQLAALWTGKRTKIDIQLHIRIIARLTLLENAKLAEDMNVSGYNFHGLKGFDPKRYTVHINGPWCVTFEFEDGHAYKVDIEQYHQERQMTDYPAIRDPNRCPAHPGAVLKDWLLDIKHTKIEIAQMLGISRQQLYDILNERKPVSANIAARIGKLLGNGAGVWLRMQVAHDAWHAEREVDLSGIPTLVDA